MSDSRPRVWLVGEHQHYEFAEPLEWLRQRAHVQWVSDIDEAERAANNLETPLDLVVLAVPRPGVFSNAEVQRLMRAVPLAQIVALLGSLCEGEAPSHQVLHGVVRVYWHQWIAHCSAQWSVAERPNLWQLPKTAAPLERLLWQLEYPRHQHSGLVAIAASGRPRFQQLSQACRQAGYQTCWIGVDPTEQYNRVRVVIWDTAQAPPDFHVCKRLAEQFRSIPILVLMDFPRHEDVQRVRANGAATVLARPFALSEFWALLATYSDMSAEPA